MNQLTDDEPKLDDVLLFNDYLLKLADAGVPISLDGSGLNDDLLTVLSKLNSIFAMGIARGKTVRNVLESERSIPSVYRSSLMTWLYCGRPPESLEALCQAANGRVVRERLVRSTILQPIILASMAYLGFLLWTLFIGPKMQAIARQIGVPPGIGLRWIEFANKTIWIWGIGTPLMICLASLVWHQYRTHWSFLWIPGRKRMDGSIQAANYASSLANLMQHNFSEEQAKDSLGPIAIHSSESHPLLQWALGPQVTKVERSGALMTSVSAFRKLAQWRTVRLESWFPIVFGALVGGAIVLAYGLSLFEPLIELLTSITQL